MRNKKTKLLITVLPVFFCCFAEGSEKLKIYLPREAQINNQNVELGKICVLSGERSLIEKANGIILGQIYDRGREITVSRTMISGRLSSNGIAVSQIEFSGAEEIKVTAQYGVIPGSRFVEIAQEFINSRIAKDGFRLNPVRTPKDLVIDGRTDEVRLTCQFLEEESNDRVCVEVTVSSKDKTIETRKVYFQKYRLSEERQINKASSNNFKQEIIVRKNKPVTVVISRPGLFITSTGRALEDGREGDCIKIKMQITDASRMILARVNNDGTVEPLL